MFKPTYFGNAFSICVTNISGLMQRKYIKEGQCYYPSCCRTGRALYDTELQPPRIFFKLRLHPADIPSGKLRIISAFQTGIPQSVRMNVSPPKPNQLCFAHCPAMGPKPVPLVRLVVSRSKRMKWIVEHHSDSCPWVPRCQNEDVTLGLHLTLLLQEALLATNLTVKNVMSRHLLSLSHAGWFWWINTDYHSSMMEMDTREWHHAASCDALHPCKVLFGHVADVTMFVLSEWHFLGTSGNDTSESWLLRGIEVCRSIRNVGLYSSFSLELMTKNK